jgi:hypothetical protein
MSRNGSGTYTLPAGNPVVTGTTIASTWANNTLSDIASALTDSVAADGQTPMTGNLNLSNNKIVNLATPTLSTDAVTKSYADALVGGSGTGSFTTLTVTGTTTLATSLTGVLKGTSGVVAVATAGTDYAGIDTAQTFTKGQRGEITALVDGATITPDFADSNNFSVTLGGNRTLANPSNTVAGQSGSIFITQDGTGSRTLAYGSDYDFAGGAAPTLSTTAGAIDRIDYVVRTATSIHAVFTANYS